MLKNVAALVLLATSAAYAGEFRCVSGDTACLIESIRIANTNGEDNRIVLGGGVYMLTDIQEQTDGANGLPSITGSIRIDGMGSVIKRDSSARGFRLLHVGPSGQLFIDSLELTGGLVGEGTRAEAGGAIFNRGTLTAERTRIHENIKTSPGIGDVGVGGGAILNSGTLILRRSEIDHNVTEFASGAGIYSSPGGSLTIEDSFIRDNIAEQGGGVVLAGGSGSILRTTIAGNVALARGGGVYNRGSLQIQDSSVYGNEQTVVFAQTGGGGIYNDGESLSIVSSTISDNFAGGSGGAIVNDGDSLVLKGTTVVRNRALSGTGGLLDLRSAAVLDHTILALNMFQELPSDCSGSTSSNGSNVFGTFQGCSVSASDLLGDPGLDAFVDDGTSGNGHYPLLPTSLAINAGSNTACPVIDQLGAPRNGSCDIGSIEFYPVVNDLLIIRSLTTDFDPTPVSGGPAGSFRISVEFINRSSQAIQHLFAEVTALSGNNLLLNADGGQAKAGGRLTPGEGGALQPGDIRKFEFVIGLNQASPFMFFVNLLGQP